MNFPLILLILTVVTGIFWVLERRSFLPARKVRAEEAARRFEADNREAIDRGEKAVIDARNDLYAREIRQPWWLEYTAGLFPVIAIVFFVRSFLFEPFRIPSGSMLPTLHVGDFILVNKYEYGIRLPVTNWKIIPLGSPQRGDVVVFKYPMDESVDYIKQSSAFRATRSNTATRSSTSTASGRSRPATSTSSTRTPMSRSTSARRPFRASST